MNTEHPLQFFTLMGDHTLSLLEVNSLRRISEEKYFTATERNSPEAGDRRLQYLAGRLAAKQSILNYLHDHAPELSWLDVEIQRLSHGSPAVVLSDRGKGTASGMGVTRWLLSISHTPRYAAASIICLN